MRFGSQSTTSASQSEGYFPISWRTPQYFGNQFSKLSGFDSQHHGKLLIFSNCSPLTSRICVLVADPPLAQVKVRDISRFPGEPLNILEISSQK